ncbi:beta-galactosidase [Pedobacter yulinensis]|uniref:Beta-galactosidase n=1 Tax=Pedobacter yulinensis TaxID=2126353 RepID=A0A2T3HME5_9SPHI|nr:sugar-binding domain-containing protein [Pedobacter yulinensis]PST83583.1 beta-galactosidase [Pedobacter yulinensis]
MNKTKMLLTAAALLFLAVPGFSQRKWAVVKDRILTPWAEQVDPKAPLPEYPRPQMERLKNWKNLNGLWSYAITPKDQPEPARYEGDILVPFAVESALSGVARTVGKDSVLWYKNTVSVPPAMRGKEVLLHFGAVDWRAEVFVNGKPAGIHEGGFDPFSFNITSLLQKGAAQEIKVKVWDPTDDGPQPRGKQVKKPEGIWYTPVTGIWQTVWLEAVPKTHIVSTRQTPDIDAQQLELKADIAAAAAGDMLKITVFDNGRQVAQQQLPAAETAVIKLKDQKLWSPESPFLYDLHISLLRNNKVIDQVKSYFAMRKISMVKDSKGIQRMHLNNKFLFQYGPLDQGWWPDGLYTPPTEAAMIYDIDKLHDMGCNMIRKHIKVEPARYYAYCDRKGMLLWQDMPSGDLGNGWEQRPGVLDKGSDRPRTPESEGYYRKEWERIMAVLHNYPSIVVWTPFNEAWGQFKTAEITEWTLKMDPSRLVNSASGGNFEPTGHMVDLHNYPHPAMPRPDLFGTERILVLGEFGGLGWPVQGHLWDAGKRNWGYQNFKNADELFARYEKFAARMLELIPLGLSAAVYTQTTDVEGEVNGYMTYDRKLMKMPVEKLRVLHKRFYDQALVK